MLLTTEESIQTLPGATRVGGNLGCGGLQQDQSDAQRAQVPADLPLAYWSRENSHLGEHFSDNSSSEIAFGTVFPKHLITPVDPPAQ